MNIWSNEPGIVSVLMIYDIYLFYIRLLLAYVLLTFSNCRLQPLDAGGVKTCVKKVPIGTE